MNNLLNSLGEVKLPTVNVNAHIDEETLRNLFLTILVSGTALMIISRFLFSNK